MAWLRQFAARFAAPFRKRKLERELNDEVRAHIEMLIDENMRRGISREEARFAALREFGGVEQMKETYRDQRGLLMIETLWQDLRYGLRMLAKNPGFAAVVIMTIALGVGINVGIFSVLNGAAFRLLPIRRAEQMVSVAQIFHGRSVRNTHGEASMFSYSEYVEYRDHNNVFSGLLAYEPFVEATVAGATMQQLLGTAT